VLAIRHYCIADRDELVSVWEAANRVGHPFFDEAELAARRLRLIERHLPASETWVAWDGERIVGGIGLVGPFVGGLFVHPSMYGRGIGRRLLEHAAARKGRLTLEVYLANPAARTFYDRCGFVAVERRELDEDGRPWPIVIMTGPLGR
jgi:GNAT superfamily N-acetyltransferase